MTREALRLRIFAAALVLCAAGAGWLMWSVSRGPRSAPLPALGTVGAFSLVDQTGARRGSADLAGAPWVVDVIFTRCQGPCPVITDRMAQLGRVLPPAFRLVTVTADPVHDTPAVIRKYIAARHLDTARWWFLTGAHDAVHGFLVGRLRVPAGEPGWRGGELVVPHTEKLVLVDGTGTIRGYYESGDPAELDRLRSDAARIP